MAGHLYSIEKVLGQALSLGGHQSILKHEMKLPIYNDSLSSRKHCPALITEQEEELKKYVYTNLLERLDYVIRFLPN